MKFYSNFDGKTQFSQIYKGCIIFYFILLFFFFFGGGGGGGGGSKQFKCLAQGYNAPQIGNPKISSQALYHWATALLDIYQW